MSEPFQLRHPSITVGLIAVVVSIVLYAALAFPFPDTPRHGCYLGPVKIAGIQPIDMTSDVSFCFLHDTPIKVKSVPIVYGLLITSLPNYLELREFPFGSTWISGGCCRSIYKYAIVSQCAKCVELRQQWNAKHPLPSDPKYDDPRPMPAMGIPTVSFEEMIIPCYVIE